MITFANAYYENSSISQMEIEYEGHINGTKTPSIKQIEESFDRIYDLMFEGSGVKATPLTKAQWICTKAKGTKLFRGRRSSVASLAT